MDAKKISRIRRAVKTAKQVSGLRVRYPKQIKAEVVNLLQSGVTPTELAEVTGLAVSTLFKWSRVSAPLAVERFRRVPVKPKASPPPAAPTPVGFIVRLPNGITVECPDTHALKEILEALK